eukprot:1155897-Pelagomonas_calceolata.AAC.2
MDTNIRAHTHTYTHTQARNTYTHNTHTHTQHTYSSGVLTSCPCAGLRRAPRSTIVCCSAHGNVQQHDQEEAPQTRAMLCRALADLREHLDTPQGKGHKDAQKVVDWFEVKMQSPKRDMEFERAVGTLLAAGNELLHRPRAMIEAPGERAFKHRRACLMVVAHKGGRQWMLRVELGGASSSPRACLHRDGLRAD